MTVTKEQLSDLNKVVEKFIFERLWIEKWVSIRFWYMGESAPSLSFRIRVRVVETSGTHYVWYFGFSYIAPAWFVNIFIRLCQYTPTRDTIYWHGGVVQVGSSVPALIGAGSDPAAALVVSAGGWQTWWWQLATGIVFLSAY